MILGQVGEGTDLQPDPVHAVLLETVAGGFHGQMRDPLAGQAIERRLQGDGVRRGVARHFDLVATGHTKRTETSGFKPRSGPDLAQELDRRAFAIGAGDSHDMPGLARIEARRHARQKGCRLVHDDDRHRCLDRRIGKDDGRAIGQCLGNEVAPVHFHAGQRGKHETRFDLAAVQRQPAHGQVSGINRQAFIKQQVS